MQSRLPTEPGRYFWDEWKREVDVYKVGNSLWVNMSVNGYQNVKISNKIAGTFTKVEKDEL